MNVRSRWMYCRFGLCDNPSIYIPHPQLEPPHEDRIDDHIEFGNYVSHHLSLRLWYGLILTRNIDPVPALSEKVLRLIMGVKT
jgi:hypothetical protein